MEEITEQERTERRKPKYSFDLSEDDKLTVTRWRIRYEVVAKNAIAQLEGDPSVVRRMQQYTPIVCDVFGPTTAGFIYDGKHWFIPLRFTSRPSDYTMWTREIQFVTPVLED